MLSKLQLIRNVGRFDSTSCPIDLKPLTLIYAENGMGKTTLSAIIRSLGTGNPIPILERRRLGATNDANVVVEITNVTGTVRFENGRWNSTLDEVSIYDDLFVEENVCSGLTIDSEHRKGLTSVILGKVGVSLKNRYDELANKIANHNRALRQKDEQINPPERGTMSIGDFCALPEITDIDPKILNIEKLLLAAKSSDLIKFHALFVTIELSPIDKDELKNFLSKGIEDFGENALTHIQTHFALLGNGAEDWVSSGMSFIRRDEGNNTKDNAENTKVNNHLPACPFCGLKLEDSDLFTEYRSYFSKSYSNLKKEITSFQENISFKHNADHIGDFERSIRSLGELRTFWSQFIELPEISIDSEKISKARQSASTIAIDLLKRKSLNPLEPIQLTSKEEKAIDNYNIEVEQFKVLLASIISCNQRLEDLKKKSTGASTTPLTLELAKIKATKVRYSSNDKTLCDEYKKELNDKAATEKVRDQTKADLEAYKQREFPNFHKEINNYLNKFGASFKVGEIIEKNTSSGPSCVYEFQINGHSVPLEGSGDSPSFRSSLSAGDRNALALAYFFVSLDRDPNLKSKVIVIDDPVSSLDDHRSFTTAQRITSLVKKSAQVIVLSHNRGFLGRIWKVASNKGSLTALKLSHIESGSELRAWDIENEAFNDHDIYHTKLKDFLHSPGDFDVMEIGPCIRPYLEGYLRTVYGPPSVNPGFSLGSGFINVCRTKLAAGSPIIKDANVLTHSKKSLTFLHRSIMTAEKQFSTQ